MIRDLQRFVLVGIVNTAFYYAVYAAGLYFGLSYPVATLIATMFGIVFSFLNFGKYVFNNTDYRRIGRFIMVYVLLYFVNIGIITAMKVVTLNYYLSGFVAVVICAGLSFLFNKFYVYR